VALASSPLALLTSLAVILACVLSQLSLNNPQYKDFTFTTPGSLVMLNLLNPSVIRWLHFECSVPCRPSRPNVQFSISDIQALWRSGVSARVPECQKLKMVR